MGIWKLTQVQLKPGTSKYQLNVWITFLPQEFIPNFIYMLTLLCHPWTCMFILEWKKIEPHPWLKIHLFWPALTINHCCVSTNISYWPSAVWQDCFLPCRAKLMKTVCCYSEVWSFWLCPCLDFPILYFWLRLAFIFLPLAPSAPWNSWFNPAEIFYCLVEAWSCAEQKVYISHWRVLEESVFCSNWFTFTL